MIMIDKPTPQSEAERIANLLAGVASHAETVASEYVAALKRHGKQLEAELVKKGYDRSWLQCLEDVGHGNADSKLLWIDPAKRTILQTVPPKRQREIMQDGVNGKPLATIKPDVLRAAIKGSPPRRMPKKFRNRVYVGAHLRQKPQPTEKPDDRIPTVFIAGKELSWYDVVSAVCLGIETGTIPESQIDRLKRAVAVAEKTRDPLVV
jgi:hypothetical protein